MFERADESTASALSSNEVDARTTHVVGTEQEPVATEPIDAARIDIAAADADPTDPRDLERALVEVQRIVVGQDAMVARLLVALLSRGHVLLEGPPGVAKTLAVSTLATVVGGTFHRLQFTPDLVPGDIVGTRVYRPGTGEFDVELGPVFANLVLADEINRAPAKVQSALLEVMGERQVSLAGKTHRLPDPFLVLATQNPIESEGVYPLPEAQRDRFLLHVVVDHPTPSEEMAILQRMGTRPPVARTVLTPEAIRRWQTRADEVFVHHAIAEYVVHLVLATRNPSAYGLDDLNEVIAVGASPRATLGLVAAARAMALLRGRDHVIPTDVAELAGDVIAHRLVPSFDALADGFDARAVVARVVAAVPPPRIMPTLVDNGLTRRDSGAA